MIIVILSFSTTKFHSGTGYWKLLKDNDFLDIKKKFIKDVFVINNETADPLIAWYAFKCTLSSHCIQYSSIFWGTYHTEGVILSQQLLWVK